MKSAAWFSPALYRSISRPFVGTLKANFGLLYPSRNISKDIVLEVIIHNCPIAFAAYIDAEYFCSTLKSEN